jgi:hypothetical protein
MNLKSKVFGMLAAAALMLSMTLGAVSADTSVSSSASTELIGGACSIVANDSANFGNWIYDGSKYNPEHGTAPQVDLSWTVTAGNPAGCTVNINFYGLQNGSSLIELNHFYASVYFGPESNHVTGTWGNAIFGPGKGHVSSGVPTGPGAVWMQLNSVPDTFMPGSYVGAIHATVQNTQ